MASKDPSRRASVASSSEASLVDPALVAKTLPKKDSIIGKVKLKKQITKPKPKEALSNENIADVTLRSPSPDSPLLNDIDSELRATFPTGRPMEDKHELLLCKHCKKPMLRSFATSHIKLCLQKKMDRAQRKKEDKEAKRKAKEAKDKAEDKDGDVTMEDSVVVGSRAGGGENESINGDSTIKTAKKSAAKATTDDASKKSKKRKADTEADKEPKKKKTKKEEQAAKPKMPKPKGPVDVEKQCGVALPNGAFCARSLTCKSHSMGAKRAVPGRSLPYDMLLAAYQKKNQAKQQKAAIDANAPLADDFETNGPIDSDEEKDAVMAAIARSRPRPLEQHIFVPIRQKYAYVRMKEMLSNALGGSRGGGLFATGDSGGGGSRFMGSVVNDVASALGTATAVGESAAAVEANRRSSLAQQAVGAQARAAAAAAGTGLPSRKASVTATSAA